MSYYDRPQMGFAFPRLTPMVKILLIVNVAVFLLNAVLNASMKVGLSEWFGLRGNGLLDGFGLGVLRVFSYQFVHSFVDPWHLLLNMLVLYFFGTMVEERLGQNRFLRLYLFAGVAGGVLHMLLMAMRGASGIPLVGASGACYGVMTYAAFMAPRTRVIFIIFPVPLALLVGLLLFLGFYSLMVELSQNVMGGTAHGAHLGGALWGAIAFQLDKRGINYGGGGGPLGKIKQWHEKRLRAADEFEQEKMDKLLDKVHREGIGALTPAEKKFLERASQNRRK